MPMPHALRCGTVRAPVHPSTILAEETSPQRDGRAWCLPPCTRHPCHRFRAVRECDTISPIICLMASRALALTPLTSLMAEMLPKCGSLALRLFLHYWTETE